MKFRQIYSKMKLYKVGKRQDTAKDKEEVGALS